MKTQFKLFRFVLTAILTLKVISGYAEPVDYYTKKPEKRNEKKEAPKGPHLYRNIYIEFMGASNTIGVSYDSRIKAGSPLGYRVGFGYAADMGSVAGLMGNHNYGMTIPLGINYLLGKDASKFEMGIGTNLGFYHEDMRPYFKNQIKDGSLSMSEIKQLVTTTFGYYIFFDLGYRLQHPNGFNLRLGISPGLNCGDSHSVIRDPLIYPYISLGYSF